MGRVGDFLVGAYCGLPEITNEFSGWQNLFTTSPPLSHLGQDLAAKDQRYDATSHKSPSDTNSHYQGPLSRVGVRDFYNLIVHYVQHVNI